MIVKKTGLTRVVKNILFDRNEPVSLVHFPKVIATTEAVKQLEEMFG